MVDSTGGLGKPALRRPRVIAAVRCSASASIPHHRFVEVFGFGVEMIALAQTQATVPAQERVVVGGRAKSFGLLVVVHGLTDPGIGNFGASRPALGGTRVGPTLPDDAAVVQPLVFSLQFWHYRLGLVETFRRAAGK